jgi:hypothetical protein
MVEECSAAARQLEAQAFELTRQVGFFRLSATATGGAIAPAAQGGTSTAMSTGTPERRRAPPRGAASGPLLRPKAAAPALAPAEAPRPARAAGGEDWQEF